MGTRTIIEFRMYGNKIQVYQHWDGCPSHTVKELEKFLAWNGKRSVQLDYTVSNFVTWAKVSSMISQIEQAKEHIKENPEDACTYYKDFVNSFDEAFSKADINDTLHTGYGILPNIIADSDLSHSYNAEWFYRVTLGNENDNINITVYKVHLSGVEYLGECWYEIEKKKIEHFTGDLEKEMKS